MLDKQSQAHLSKAFPGSCPARLAETRAAAIGTGLPAPPLKCQTQEAVPPGMRTLVASAVACQCLPAQLVAFTASPCEEALVMGHRPWKHALLLRDGLCGVHAGW